MFSLFLFKTARASEDCSNLLAKSDCLAASHCSWASNTAGNSQHVFVTEKLCLLKNFTLPEQVADSCSTLQTKPECTANSACIYSIFKHGTNTAFRCSEYTAQDRPCSASSAVECATLEDCSWYSITSKRSEEAVCLVNQPIVPTRHRGFCKKFDNDKLGCNAEKMCDYVEFSSENGENARFCNAEAAKYLHPSFDDGGVCEVNYDEAACQQVDTCEWVKTETPIGDWSWCAANFPPEMNFPPGFDGGKRDDDMLVIGILFAFLVVVLLCTCIFMCVLLSKVKKQSEQEMGFPKAKSSEMVQSTEKRAGDKKVPTGIE